MTTVKLGKGKNMSFVARKDTRSSSSYYRRRLQQFNEVIISSPTKRHTLLHYKNLGVPGVSKKYISESPGRVRCERM